MDCDRLKKRREELQMTQQEVADAAGIAQQAYARLESGERNNPTINTLEAIAQALRCRVDDLLSSKPGKKAK